MSGRISVATSASIYRCEAGFGIVVASELGIMIHHLPFELSSHAEARELISSAHPEAAQESPMTRNAASLVARYFAGERVIFDCPLDLEGFTDFQRRVYRAVAGIGYGSVLSYAEVGALCGCPKGARAIGGAMGKNPVPIFVPCHRVVGAGGAMTGFTAPGGIDSKRKLLALEGAVLGRSGQLLRPGFAGL